MGILSHLGVSSTHLRQSLIIRIVARTMKIHWRRDNCVEVWRNNNMDSTLVFRKKEDHTLDPEFVKGYNLFQLYDAVI